MSSGNDSSERKRSFSALSDGGDAEDRKMQGDKSSKNPVEEKKMKRVMANRRSAKESRERRKKLLTELEASVDILTKENTALAAENAELRKQVVILLPQARANMSLLQQHQAPTQRSFAPDFLNSNSLSSDLMNAALSKERALFDAQTSLLRHAQF